MNPLGSTAVTTILLLIGRSLALSAMPSRIATAKGLKLSSQGQCEGKTIILIRHGCTYMNEYLAVPGNRWGDSNFTDIFEESVMHLYRDTPLSTKGMRQAKNLASAAPRDKYTGERIDLSNIVDLVVVSPLTRALQTTELGIFPHFAASNTPFVALQLATERLYLISDVGSPISKISSKFPFVDFKTEFKHVPTTDEWWYTHKDEFYDEWRPCGQGQRYSCRGEPDDHFNKRMAALYDWLESREETVIALICHYGVIEYLTGGEEFGNCEIASFKFSQLTRDGIKMKYSVAINTK